MKEDGLHSFTRFTMQKNELAEKIELSIEDKSVPLWFPNLTAHLAKTGWQSLKNEFGLTSSNYGTARILSSKIDTPLSIVSLKDITNFIPIEIELLPKEIADNYSSSQIYFYNAAELTNPLTLKCVSEALELIKTVPSLSKSIFILVNSLHLIKLEDDAYDVSFSEPQLPFSIFVSVPKNRIRSDFLRVAEAIVHEAMHLQLSLIEKVVPLLNLNEKKFYSPWKDEYRDSTGLLHALYVFRVIESFYELLELKQCLPSQNLDFIKNRRRKILQQINEIKEFSRNPDLTEYGLRLTKRLLI